MTTETAQDYLAPLKEVAQHVDNEREREGWDSPHELYAVIRKDQPGTATIGLLPMPAWRTCCEALPETQDALNAMCATMEAAPGELKKSTFPQRHLYGVALVAEAWMLRGKGRDEPVPEEYTAAAREHRINSHPDRVEIRFVHVAPILGEPLMLVRERGGQAKFWDSDSTQSVSGEVPRLLARLAQAIVVPT